MAINQNHLDQWSRSIESVDTMLGLLNDDPDNATVQAIVEALQKAQDALDAATAAHNNGNEEEAARMLQESMDHTAEAIKLLKELVE